jgi:hypothetical protein
VIVETLALLVVLSLPAIIVLGWLAFMGLAVAALADADTAPSTDPAERRPSRPVSLRLDPTLSLPAAVPSH